MVRKIKELSEKDKVRKKISVWLGSSTNHIHTVKELIGNSADEIVAGKGDHISIRMIDDKTIEFQDNCQGLPIEGETDKGTPNYVALFETLFAGTKYDQTSATVGTNGVFLAVLTFSSKKVKYEVARPNGKVYGVEYFKGDRVTDFGVIGESDSTYTRITFELDDEVYDSTTFNYEDICDIARGQASLFTGSIDVSHEPSGQSEHFEFPNGVSDLLAWYNRDQKVLHNIENFKLETTSYVEKHKRDDVIGIDMAFQYSKEDETVQKEFLNGSDLVYHGTIQDGLIQGLRYAINSYIKKNGMYKKNEKQVSSDDVMTGFSYIVDFKSHLCEFENQTKLATKVPHYKTIISQMIQDKFEIFSIENPIDMEKIAKQVLINKRARENAEKTRTQLKNKLSQKITTTNRVDNFYDCRTKKVEDRVLFLTEGLSALGSVVVGRDSETQACLPLRGKILNCLKADLKQIANNDIIVDVFRVLGCGIEIRDKKFKDLGEFNMDNLRYNKIVISTDTDVDGLQIRCLILAMFYRLAPSLLKAGKVYLSEAPLYEIIDKSDNTYYAYTDEGRDKIVAELGDKMRRQHYCKGLGEINADTLSETMLKEHNFQLITFEDVEADKDVFEMWMGDDVQGRKDYIVNNFDAVEGVID